MTLLITLFAAIVATIAWRKSLKGNGDTYKLATLCYLYWGAVLMWFIDFVFEISELGLAYFTKAAEEFADDSKLGICAIGLGITIWAIVALKQKFNTNTLAG